MSDLHQIVGFGPDGIVQLHDHGGGVVLVNLNDPQRRNAMSVEMTEAWRSAMDHLRGRTDLRCVVLTGTGRAFCAGGDLGWLGAEPGASVAQLRHRMMPFYQTWLAIRDIGVPTIAAINGAAVGAGAALALACDIRLAAESGSFSVPFTALGLHPGMGITYLLPAVVGLSAARELLLTGRRIDAEQMSLLGMVTEVVVDDELLQRALATAHVIAATAPVAAEFTRLALAEGAPADLAAALRWEGVVQSVTLATQDVSEGLSAARERRTPRFTGR
ncbi:MAG: enoyl-CoA hydratase/isomerase family protein [Actinomycetes bacterium]|jgi:enoyl-CoA hydratase/carnithine racemase|nr:enoyl-CoA hydratase/isomerase family protein [Candidatus Nanopelagicales bacterium]MDP4824772.1 enoyl-CoA hydratase/isomerase family protein [Candidatus Nanopelagicales bacterium]MDP4888613.1 enoyl-CoA hydratase/isomerase family protein [Candidatus Nanopelagicales bacterium]